MAKKKKPIHKHILRHKLKIRHTASYKRLAKKHPHIVAHFRKYKLEPGKIRDHAKKLAASSALAGTLLAGSPVVAQIPTEDTEKVHHMPLSDRQHMFAEEVRLHLPEDPAKITPGQEENISTLVKHFWGINATSLLEGHHLNHSYGYMGAEQHLPRYPGDTVSQHDEYQQSGITPARGAFGYFAPSHAEMTQEMIQQEKYYLAVQTLYLPEWNTNWGELKKWYKFRKMLVINPDNGKAMVAVVGDAGPAKWTGKQYGGSPEVMKYLELQDGRAKKKVFVLFVDDPNNEIPLGPLEYNYDTINKLTK